jgi:bifunctional N-acetylglucosamine-1-phosphate-uridyltransferase/glucosamine-1-phosphate-acetyltransferase GlmU-like protein
MHPRTPAVAAVAAAGVGDACEVGPYAFLPEGTKIESGAKTGAFYDGSQ